MVNGRIVWLLPHQNGNFTQAKMQKADLKILAKSVKKAKPAGKPTEHLISGGNESYSVIGKANINGTEQGIKVIISKHTDGRYFYLSVFSLKKI